MAMKIVVGMNAGVVCSNHTGGTTLLGRACYSMEKRFVWLIAN